MFLILTTFFVMIIISAVTSWVLINSEYNGFTSFVGVCLAAIVGITAIGYTFTVWEWVGSQHKAKVINEQFGTNYSREEVFWSGDVIYSIHKPKKEQVNE